jgi:hypothetical protein
MELLLERSCVARETLILPLENSRERLEPLESYIIGWKMIKAFDDS